MREGRKGNGVSRRKVIYSREGKDVSENEGKGTSMGQG